MYLYLSFEMNWVVFSALGLWIVCMLCVELLCSGVIGREESTWICIRRDLYPREFWMKVMVICSCSLSSSTFLLSSFILPLPPPTAMEAPDFPTALANIRRLTASKLPHQAKPAQLLTAIESTLATTLTHEQGPPFSPTAYFASLVGCLAKACAQGSKDADDFSEGGLVPAALYLLAAVAPETPRQVIVNQQQALVPLLVSLFDKSLAHPPALRSLIGIITVVLTATPASGLNASPLLKRAWNHLLELNLDSRPKVRHLAQQGVKRTLGTPIPPKLVAGDHPYLPRARDWVAGVLRDEAKGGASQAQGKKVKFAGVKGAVMQGSEDMEGKRAIWVIQGLRGWVNVWGQEVGFKRRFSPFFV